jgi:hypothetical protein
VSKALQHQIVARARKIISNPAHWTQGELALFKNNRSAKPWHQRAQRFCAVGALVRAAHHLARDPLSAEQLADQALLAVSNHADIPDNERLEAINDGRNGHATVLRLFDAFLAGRPINSDAWLHNLFPLAEDDSLEGTEAAHDRA